MNRRLTSLLVGALAAVLLGVPAQAQDWTKKAYGQKSGKLVENVQQREHHALDNVAQSPEFRKLSFAEQQKARTELQRKRDASQTHAITSKHSKHILPSKANELGTFSLLKGGHVVKQQAMRVPYKASDETVDMNGLITAPAEGEHKFYTRQGGAWYNNNGYLDEDTQSGHVEIVECADGTIYVKDIVSHLSNDTWVKGTKDGNTITVSTGQPVAYSTAYFATLSIYWGRINSAGTSMEKDASAESVTFTIDGDAISMLESDEYNFMGIFWDDDNSFSGYGDFQTVWTYDAEYVPASTELVTPPDGLETSQLYLVGYTYSGEEATKVKTVVNVGFAGNDVYLQGLFKSFPESWIKGTVDGGIVTFPKFQYLGAYGSYSIWLIGVSYDEENDDYLIEDFKMAYDSESQVFTSINDAVANAAEDRILYLTWMYDINISTEAPGEEEAETGAPIDVLPYVNSFDTEEEINAMGIIDSNDDYYTWSSSGSAFYYSYTSSADADDWLVTPAIYLEPGKKYAFSIDTYCASPYYPERLEVKMGNAAKASAMTQSIIPATDVEETDPMTLTSDPITVDEAGYFFFGIHAISDADRYNLYVDNLLIEAVPEPLAPGAISDLVVETTVGEQARSTITFTAPTTCVDGSALTDNITKIELYRDGKVITSFENVAPGTKIEYVDQAEDLTAGNHTYQAIPYNAYGIGKKSNVDSVFVSVINNVPYTADLSDPDVFATFKAVDANEDEITWVCEPGYGAYVSYNSYLDMDDYLISQPVQLAAGQNYNVVVNAYCNSEYYPERLEVLVGTAPDPASMTIQAIAPTDITSTLADDFEGGFSVSADGLYYVAIHGISDADKYLLIVNSLTVEKGPAETAPAAPRVSVQPDPYGAEKAVITVMAPANNVAGDKLTDNIAELGIYRNGVLVKTFANVRPQDTKVFVDFVDESGEFTYQAVPYEANGDRGLKSSKQKVYVGLDIPAPVENAVAIEGEEEVTLTWDPVTTGLNGGVVVPSDVEYEIWTGHEEVVWFWTIVVLDEKLATTKETSITLPYDVDGDPAIDELFILPRNEKGAPEEDYATGVNFFTGAPVDLPFEEHFATTGLNYNWLIYGYSGNVDFNITADDSDGDGGALTSYGYDEGYISYTPGKVAVTGANPTLIIDVKGDMSRKNQLRVVIQTPDGKQTTAAIIIPEESYQTVKVSLADFANDAFIKPYFITNFKEYGEISFDNVRMTDLLEYNLTTAVEAPKSVLAGNTAKVNVTVRNIGERVAENYAVKLFVGDEEVLNQKVTDGLASFATNVISYDYATTIFSEAGDLTVRAEVEYDIDLDDEDNMAETTLTVKQSTAAQPENLKAEKSDDGVTLTWDAPSSNTEQVTEDFENTDEFEPFSVGGITADNQYGAFGDWTLYDGNNTTVYGFSSFTFENSTVPQAWQVFNPAVIGAEESFPAYSGEQFLWSFCPVDETGAPAADHWLISPELPGVAQTISFVYRAITDAYGAETFEVLYSTTNNNPASFVKVKDFSTTATEWTEASVDLPEGAVYFAIRHTSTDIFGLLIDDVAYTRGGGSVAKYNVYVNRSLYDDTTATSLEVKGVTAGEFAVTAVMTTGAESAPVIVIIDAANQQPTAIELITGSQEPADVYTLDGRLVRQQTTDLRGLKGAYVIQGQKVILK